MSHFPLWGRAPEKLLPAVDPEHLVGVNRVQEQAWNGEPLQRVPVVATFKDPACPLHPYAEAFENPKKPFWNELSECYASCLIGDNRPLNIWANHGTCVPQKQSPASRCQVLQPVLVN